MGVKHCHSANEDEIAFCGGATNYRKLPSATTRRDCAREKTTRRERERTLGGLVESVTRLAWRRYSDVVHNVSQYNIRRVRQRLKPHRRYTGLPATRDAAAVPEARPAALSSRYPHSQPLQSSVAARRGIHSISCIQVACRKESIVSSRCEKSSGSLSLSLSLSLCVCVCAILEI